ncbi:MAG: NTP transferase domain-containing protein, partial [Pyrobaculum sp.]
MKVAPVVLAGGKPGHFEKIVGNLPKTYLKVGGRRLYQYAADALYSIFGRVYVVSPRPEGEKYIYIEESGGGIEAAIAAAESQIGSETHLLFTYGDVYTDPAAYRALIEAAISTAVDGAVLAVPRRETKGYGILETREGGLLAKIGREGQWIFGGVALLPRDIVKKVDNLYWTLNEVAKSRKIAVVPWGGVWHDVNYPEDILQLLEHTAPQHTYIARSAKISPTAVLEGPVAVSEDVEIDHYAVVKGPTYLGRGVFIGSHTLVRNHTSVDEGAVVGSSVEVSHSLIGGRATVGRASFISY